MKKKLLILMTFALAIAMFIPFDKAYAGVTDNDDENSNITRITTTNYHTTVKFVGTFTDEETGESETFERTSDEVAANYNEEAVTAIVEGYNSEFTTWSNEKGATKTVSSISGLLSDYYYEAHDEITASNECNNGEYILVGDIYDMNAAYSNCSITINTILDKHQTYQVTVKVVKEDKRIKEVNLTAEKPKVGDEITATDGDWDTQRPQATITVPNSVKYKVYDQPNENYMYYSEHEDDTSPFVGAFEKGKMYFMQIWIDSIDGYYFTPETKIKVNGEDAEIQGLSENEISIMYKFKPTANQKEYTLTNDFATISFTYDEGYDFDFQFVDVLTLTEEQRQEMEISEEEYNSALELITNSVKAYGNLIGVYAIEVNDSGMKYTGEVKLKVKLTDEMKKYNSFKFIYVDENNNFKVGEIKDFTIEGDYLVGTLPHLSAYALVGSTINNPKTGDNIMVFVILFGASIIGLTSVKLLKKKKQN